MASAPIVKRALQYYFLKPFAARQPSQAQRLGEPTRARGAGEGPGKENRDRLSNTYRGISRVGDESGDSPFKGATLPWPTFECTLPEVGR